MVYFKYTDDNYIYGISTNDAITGGNITEAEYNEILTIIQNQPTPKEGYGLRLKTDLTWEEYELPIEPDPDPDPESGSEEDMQMALEVLGVKP